MESTMSNSTIHASLERTIRILEHCSTMLLGVTASIDRTEPGGFPDGQYLLDALQHSIEHTRRYLEQDIQEAKKFLEQTHV